MQNVQTDRRMHRPYFIGPFQLPLQVQQHIKRQCRRSGYCYANVYNLLEYSDNFSMALGNLWNYYRDETNDDADENNDND